MHDFTPPLASSGRHRAGRGRRADRRRRCSISPRPGRRQRQWKAETGAKLTLMRWKRFVQAEDDAFNDMVEAFKSGHRHRDEHVQRILRRRAAEGLGRREYRFRASTWPGACIRCRIVPDQGAEDERCRRLSRQEIRRLDRCRGKDLQARATTGLAFPSPLPAAIINYRKSAVRKGRFQGISEGLPWLPRAVQGAEEEQHAGRLCARPCLGRRQRLAALGAVGLWRLHRRQGRQGHHQLAGDREGAGIRQGALRHLHSRHRVLERLVQQQGVPVGRALLDHNGISIYVAAKDDPAKKDLADDTYHAYRRSVRSASRPNCISRFRSWPSTSRNIRMPRKAFIAFMLEKEHLRQVAVRRAGLSDPYAECL